MTTSHPNETLPVSIGRSSFGGGYRAPHDGTPRTEARMNRNGGVGIVGVIVIVVVILFLVGVIKI
jgi:hypothetical protein